MHQWFGFLEDCANVFSRWALSISWIKANPPILYNHAVQLSQDCITGECLWKLTCLPPWRKTFAAFRKMDRLEQTSLSFWCLSLECHCLHSQNSITISQGVGSNRIGGAPCFAGDTIFRNLCPPRWKPRHTSQWELRSLSGCCMLQVGGGEMESQIQWYFRLRT